MKSILIALMCISILSCKKKNTNAIPENEIISIEDNIDLSGKWNWVMSSGGYSGEIITPNSSGNNKIIEFTSDSIFRSFTNNNLNIETIYQIVKSKSYFSLDSVFVIKYANQNITQSIRPSHPDTLILNDESMDGYTNVYTKIH